MLLVTFLALFLVIATTLVHGVVLAPAISAIHAFNKPKTIRLVTVATVVVTIHVIEAGLYAVGFSLGADWGLGGFKQTDAMNWMDYLYFSLVNYNTLGLGDIYPTDHLRFLAGVEALNGFLLISCSATFVHKFLKQIDE